MKSVEVQLNEALETIKRQEKEIVSLKTAVHTKQIMIASIQRDALLKEAKLPESCIRRLHEAFKTSLDNAGLRQAINVEKRRV